MTKQSFNIVLGAGYLAGAVFGTLLSFKVFCPELFKGKENYTMITNPNLQFMQAQVKDIADAARDQYQQYYAPKQ